MRFACCWAVVVTLALVIGGCERRPAARLATAPSDRASNTPTTTATTAPAEPSFMLIDGRRVEFPPAKLRVRDRGDVLAAVLYSDDPKNAIDDRYAGNSFYFDMTLDVTDLKDLGASQWNFRATSSERMETVSGIFLEGRKYHLQVSDVSVEFDRSESPVTAWVQGTFLMFDPIDETLPPRVIPVQGELKAELTVKKR